MAESFNNLSKNIILHGYSPLAPEDILKTIEHGGDISKIPGDFVIVNKKENFAISSFLSALPYYYAVGLNGSLLFGKNVFDVAKISGLKWKWNSTTIRCLGLYGHSINSDTLCEGIFRMPAASKVSLINGKISVEALKMSSFRWDQEKTMDNAFHEMNRSFGECVSNVKDIHLSLSAGYDSRLLLAMCLSKGLYPKVSVMGNHGSTDVVVAEEICKKIGLQLDIFKIEQTDYLDLGSKISKVTSGVKTSINWHTYIYGEKKDFSKGIHLVGSNGEFARNDFFFKFGKLNFIAEVSPSFMLKYYWMLRLKKRQSKFSKHNPFIGSNVYTLNKFSGFSKVGPQWGVSKFLPACDAFYSGKRVRNFIGAGLACYSVHGNPRSPFLDAAWMRAVAKMDRKYKQDNYFHATSTKLLYSELSEFDYNKTSNNKEVISYNPFAELVESKLALEMLIESIYLDQWITKEERIELFKDSNCSQLEERNFWMTLHYAAQVVADSKLY